ncbi:MAG TPA: hypothetical protein VF919_16930 [Gemmatimonadales bacterium]
MRIVGVSVPVLICILCVSAAAGAQDLGEALVVTATRTPEANAPSNVTVIEGAAIRDSKALDEALRADPSRGGPGVDDKGWAQVFSQTSARRVAKVAS